jgi:hypothetical protein
MVETKGSSLVLMKDRLQKSFVPSFILIDLNTWRFHPDLVLETIARSFKGCLLAIRSSAGNEDGSQSSGAGKYFSALNIPSENPAALAIFIDRVIGSYGDSAESIVGATVIVQEMVSDVSVSGVVLTQHMSTSAPYYVINYDDVSVDTSTVTSGRSQDSNRSLYIHRKNLHCLRSERFQRLVDAVQEIEEVFENNALDIEFVIDSDNKVFILQARPIPNFVPLEDLFIKEIDGALLATSQELESHYEQSKSELGRGIIWGQMPDWNPAEMIGEIPRLLASSLYSRLITNFAWWEARNQMGYKVPKSKKLMHMFAGHPYINVRSSLQSYLPSSLSDTHSDSIIAIWLQTLKNDPKKHDKLEFEVAVSGYSLDLSDQIRLSLGEGIDGELIHEFEESILEQTRVIFANGKFTSLYESLESARRFAAKFTDTKSTNMIDLESSILECIENGTIPFAIAARHAFIAKNILNSMTRLGIISTDDLSQLRKSIQTVTTAYTVDLERLNNRAIDLQEFMSKYGHLRPGTYDISSPRYDQLVDPLTVLNDPMHVNSDANMNNWLPSDTILQSLDRILSRHQLGVTATQLFKYIVDATAAREECKFLFTKYLSNLLETIADYGNQLGISREMLSNIDIESLLSIKSFDSSERTVELEILSTYNDFIHRIHSCIRMPELIFDATSVFVVPFQVGRPNFVTNVRVTAPVLKLEALDFGRLSNLQGHLILIDNADPGFDWIFGHNIRGLITKFGGVNSHMSIRCAELGLPAAIGCGFQIFNRLEKANVVDLDCEARLINVVS